MLNLFFNTKITKASSNRNNGDYFYPVTYPNLNSNSSSIDILLQTIKSYRTLAFDHAIFNIDLEGSFVEFKDQIESVMRSSINANHLHIKFSRPANLSDWRSSVQSVVDLVGGDSILLVAMNHDHPFVDYSSLPFIGSVESIFNRGNFKKVFYYSHSPELLSWALNGKDRGKYKDIGGFLFQSTKIDNWLDSFCVMTSNTLAHILSCASSVESYMGRIDWPGVKYRNLDLTAFISGREFFRHYDGYGHVTGIRLFSGINDFPNVDPSKLDFQKQCNFYYQKWIDVSLLAIKDRLALRKPKAIKAEFIDCVNSLFEIFKATYLEQDRALGILSNDQFEMLVDAVYERIFFDANNLLIQVDMDIKLQPRDGQLDILSRIPFGVKRLIKKLIGR
jgi:hypothetical protein